MEKEKITKLKFNKSASVWRKVQEGLNIFGICCNPECKAHEKEVIFLPNFEEHIFNLNDNITKITCPICHTIIKLKTCGFWKCEYQFIGDKIEGGKKVHVDTKSKETNGDNFEYFNPYKNQTRKLYRR